MRARSGDDLLTLPVGQRGIQLARPVDLLLDLEARRALGFVVRSRDDVQRFLPFGAARVRERGIEVKSALALVDDVAFYRRRGQELSALRGARVERRGRSVGSLADVVVDVRGPVTELVVRGSDGSARILFDHDVVLVTARRTSAA